MEGSRKTMKGKDNGTVSYPTEPLKEHPSTYFVEDRANQEERDRLEAQDAMLTVGMGGVLPELDDTQHICSVLDVGCGTGGWLMETAKMYPTIERLVGVDISSKMLAYARDRATAQHLDGRVEFRVMDALRVVDFPAASFDLVNLRLGASWLRIWEWPKIFAECQRVCRSSGVIRMTESNVVIESNSPALTRLGDIVLEAASRSGRLFTSGGDGVTGRLAHLMTQHGIENIQTRVHTLVYRAGTNAHQSFSEDMARFYRVALPFLQKWANVPGDYQEIYQQAKEEMLSPRFEATWTFLTAWGTRSQDESMLGRIRYPLF
jgi:ubiquinone/menaquinone biosynthesis C-methylase UbiE